MASLADSVELTVGGCKFTLGNYSELKKFSSAFASAVTSSDGVIYIDRDGRLFRFISAFLVNGQLPRDLDGRHSLDANILDSLKIEASYFGISSLIDECDLECRTKSVSDPATSFMTIRKYLSGFYNSTTLEIVYESTPLLRALDEVWTPFCLTGVLHVGNIANQAVFKHSTINELKLDELIAAATQSPFGRGTETIFDPSVRNSFEIPASDLRPETLEAISSMIDVSALSRTQQLTLKPYKLVIYKEGGHFDAHRDTVRGEGHIGTLVVILNSAYTGGELEVSHGKKSESVTKTYSWVAMYGDCLHKIHPVTSGTRVSLIYDIYASATQKVNYDHEYDQHKGINVLPPTFARLLREPLCSDEAIQHLARGVDDKLRGLLDAGADSLIVTLQHLYPECQTSPAFLKGGDRALHDLLSQHYDVRVEASTLHRQKYSAKVAPRLHGALFAGGFEHSDLAKKVKVYIPHALSPESVLDYTPYIAHTGNMAQTEDTSYIVAGLQFRAKSA